LLSGFSTSSNFPLSFNTSHTTRLFGTGIYIESCIRASSSTGHNNNDLPRLASVIWLPQRVTFFVFTSVVTSDQLAKVSKETRPDSAI
jgi:hypothetical protein